MRLVNDDTGQGPPRAGVVRDGEIVDVWEALGEEPRGVPGLGGLVLMGGIDGVEEGAAAGEPRFRLDAVRLQPPIRLPRKSFSLALTYRSPPPKPALHPPEPPTSSPKSRTR